jgi:hypothetical protein
MAPARRHTRHLIGRLLMAWGKHVSERREDAVEGSVREGQILGVALSPFDIESLRFGFGFPGLEQLGRKVEPGHASPGAGRRPSSVAGAAGDVECCHLRPDSGASDDEFPDV